MLKNRWFLKQVASQRPKTICFWQPRLQTVQKLVVLGRPMLKNDLFLKQLFSQALNALRKRPPVAGQQKGSKRAYLHKGF